MTLLTARFPRGDWSREDAGRSDPDFLVDLCQAYSGVDNTAMVYAFFLVWPCYGLTHLGACFFRQEPDPDENFYPKNLSLTKDVLYAGLDVFSKAVFAWYTSSMAFNKSVLGS